MIDLHIHTIHSDGEDSVENILKQAESLNLEVISITDHDCVDAYDELSNFDVRSMYSGKIISGVEFTTTFDGYTTEILGYGCDYKIIQKVLKEFYTPEFVEIQHNLLMQRMASIVKQHGLIFDFSNKENCDSFMSYYKELSKYEENFAKVPNKILDSFGNFIRKGYANPTSSFYVDKSTCYLKFADIVDIIHKAGGKAFLAHAFLYQFDDIECELDKMLKTTNLDGLECYYHSFRDEQTKYILNYAKKHNLLTSGGSDYHGAIRPQSKLGVGSGNLNIQKDILDNWKIEYFA